MKEKAIADVVRARRRELGESFDNGNDRSRMILVRSGRSIIQFGARVIPPFILLWEKLVRGAPAGPRVAGRGEVGLSANARGESAGLVLRRAQDNGARLRKRAIHTPPPFIFPYPPGLDPPLCLL